MSQRPAKLGILEDQLLAGLREQLKAASGTDRDTLIREFRARATDYQTLRLMDELPAHARGALSAFQQIDPSPDRKARETLLTLLRDVYLSAANQSGQ